jgi:hypothetical protein
MCEKLARLLKGPASGMCRGSLTRGQHVVQQVDLAMISCHDIFGAYMCGS